MLERKKLEEQIANFEKKEKQLQKRKVLLQNREQKKERKFRTRQLIQIGALACKIFNLDYKTDMKEIENQLIKISEEIKKNNQKKI